MVDCNVVVVEVGTIVLFNVVIVARVETSGVIDTGMSSIIETRAIEIEVVASGMDELIGTQVDCRSMDTVELVMRGGEEEVNGDVRMDIVSTVKEDRLMGEVNIEIEIVDGANDKAFKRGLVNVEYLDRIDVMGGGEKRVIVFQIGDREVWGENTKEVRGNFMRLDIEIFYGSARN